MLAKRSRRRLISLENPVILPFKPPENAKITCFYRTNVKIGEVESN
jgi:hypothetical protein